VDELLTMAGSLGGAADRLAGAARQLDEVAGVAASFGGDNPGRAGVLGRRLFAQWTEAIDARRREVAEALDEMSELTSAVRRAEVNYGDAECGAMSRLIPRQT